MGGQESGTPVPETLTTEQVMALPEIIYVKPQEEKTEAQQRQDVESTSDDRTGTLSSVTEQLTDVHISVGSGSDDAKEGSEKEEPQKVETNSQPQSPKDEEQPLPTKSTTNGRYTTNCTECSICIDEFEVGQKIRILPRCGHAFHTDCITPWLTERQGCCPLCKSEVLGTNDGNNNNNNNVNTPARSNIDQTRSSNESLGNPPQSRSKCAGNANSGGGGAMASGCR